MLVTSDRLRSEGVSCQVTLLPVDSGVRDPPVGNDREQSDRGQLPDGVGVAGRTFTSRRVGWVASRQIWWVAGAKSASVAL